MALVSIFHKQSLSIIFPKSNTYKCLWNGIRKHLFPLPVFDAGTLSVTLTVWTIRDWDIIFFNALCIVHEWNLQMASIWIRSIDCLFFKRYDQGQSYPQTDRPKPSCPNSLSECKIGKKTPWNSLYLVDFLIKPHWILFPMNSSHPL